jgi:acetyl-CoA synthetase
VAPRDGATVIVGDAHGPGFVAAYAPSGELLYYNDTYERYHDVDPTPAGRLTVSYVANSFVEPGIKKGDAIAIDMVMTAEAVAIYLGIVKVGAAVVSIADSLAPAEVKKRLDIANAKLIFTQDVIVRGGKELPLYLKILEAEPEKVVVLPGKQQVEADLRNTDLSWGDFLSDKTDFDSVACTPEEHCNILFSSGTTGTPKAIPWTHTTPIRCAVDGYIHQDIHRNEVVAWPTNIGWMMGPWLIFASLINKATIALYYGVPTGREFGQFVQNAKVNMLGVVPSMVKQWKETDCMEGLDWGAIKCFSSTGEASNPVDYHWLMARAGYRPVIEYCGGTEVGGGYATGTVVQPAIPATFSTPAVGLDYLVFDEEGKSSDSGELFLVPPSIGFSLNLLNKDHHEVYFKDTPEVSEDAKGVWGDPVTEQVKEFEADPQLRRHGDEIELLTNGYARALGRADDTMNIGGIKVGSKEIERLLEVIEGVSEVAAIAVTPEEGGPAQLVIYAVLSPDAEYTKERLQKQFQRTIKKELNPLFKIYDVVLVDELPRTASNKVMRRVLRDEYSG